MIKEYRAAVVQMNSQPDLEQNLEQAYKLIKKSVSEGASLVGLPENFAFLGGLDQRIEQASAIYVQSQKFLRETAAEFGIYLLGGGFPVPAGDAKVYNRSLLVGPDGNECASYDKMHLFDVDLDGGESYRESDYVEAGPKKVIVSNTPEAGAIGLTICYDLRFPELYRALVKKGAEILTIPAAFTKTTGEKHWEILLRARAIENTSYVFAPAQTGTHGPNRKTYGHAAIIDPWGDVLADAGTEPGFAIATVEPEVLHASRQSIPSIKHRKL